MRILSVILALCAIFSRGSHAFSWKSEKLEKAIADQGARGTPSEVNPRPSRRPDYFAVALSELQELESEPLCHRVAARLLVNNCQLVDGKDEASILTDSGRKVRDFVDSYAASLAICDLERGSFSIPEECSKFRERALSQIAMRNEPQLHVSPNEISLCLSSLAASDAAWSTWISYRHKALRFCEAARVDNDKDQSILLYQRLTKIIAKLTEGVEVELQKRMDDLDNRARQSVENLEKLNPQVDKLQQKLVEVNKYLSADLETTLKSSSASMNDGFRKAESLQQLLSALLANVLQNNSQLSRVHEQSLQQVSRRTNDDLGALVAIVAAAAASSTALQQQMEVSNAHAAELAARQNTLEKGMDQLLVLGEQLSQQHAMHTNMLKSAANLTSDILDVLKETASAASSVNKSLLEEATSGTWWPYFICPTVALVMGSYGLPPSAFRNLGLVALGEVIGRHSHGNLGTPGVEAKLGQLGEIGEEFKAPGAIIYHRHLA
ncbi:hypothetical protein B0T22DRAFT_444773 [Podospora appendiculata]|uniref:Nuclear membrane fusion protein Kar5 n=1 Tax=Podospora appendiculata TaxID=314037 RepID=A0AAE0X113_9PEZI|nr:hypothetical protein B0T22DRAFT_444773 [Podospora appendiculata]